MKLPFPLHPAVTPVSVHVPETALLVSVPCRVSELPFGFSDCRFIPKAPVTSPLKFPFTENDPVSVAPEAKQGDSEVKARFATVTSGPLLCVRDVVKLRAGVLFRLVNVAVQLPLMLVLPEAEVLPPHPLRTAARAKGSKMPKRV